MGKALILASFRHTPTILPALSINSKGLDYARSRSGIERRAPGLYL